MDTKSKQIGRGCCVPVCVDASQESIVAFCDGGVSVEGYSVLGL